MNEKWLDKTLDSSRVNQVILIITAINQKEFKTIGISRKNGFKILL